MTNSQYERIVGIRSVRYLGMVGPGRFEHPTNRSLNALNIYEPGALTGLSYGPRPGFDPVSMLFQSQFKRFPHLGHCYESAGVTYRTSL